MKPDDQRYHPQPSTPVYGWPGDGGPGAKTLGDNQAVGEYIVKHDLGDGTHPGDRNVCVKCGGEVWRIRSYKRDDADYGPQAVPTKGRRGDNMVLWWGHVNANHTNHDDHYAEVAP